LFLLVGSLICLLVYFTVMFYCRLYKEVSEFLIHLLRRRRRKNRHRLKSFSWGDNNIPSLQSTLPRAAQRSGLTN
jgi:hypothetical protein